MHRRKMFIVCLQCLNPNYKIIFLYFNELKKREKNDSKERPDQKRGGNYLIRVGQLQLVGQRSGRPSILRRQVAAGGSPPPSSALRCILLQPPLSFYMHYFHVSSLFWVGKRWIRWSSRGLEQASFTCFFFFVGVVGLISIFVHFHWSVVWRDEY